MALSLSGSASGGFARGCEARPAQPHGNGEATTFQRNDKNGNNHMVPHASLCHATARADTSRKGAERERPNTSYEANQHEFLSKPLKRFLFRGSTGAAARNCKVNSCGTMRQLMERLRAVFNSAIHKVLSCLTPELHSRFLISNLLAGVAEGLDKLTRWRAPARKSLAKRISAHIRNSPPEVFYRALLKTCCSKMPADF